VVLKWNTKQVTIGNAMENNAQLVEQIVKLRTNLINKYGLLKDYKQNKNALMKEEEYARHLHAIIVEIDGMLDGLVSFK
jgi:hypothetical protein